MAGVLDREHRVARHSMSRAFTRIINDALTVEVLVFSPDGDRLATVIISKAEAVRLVSLPVMMGQAFRAARENGGPVFVEAAE